MSRPNDNALIELWRVQSRLGIKPADRRIPSSANDRDSFERDLAVIREVLERH